MYLGKMRYLVPAALMLILSVVTAQSTAVAAEIEEEATSASSEATVQDSGPEKSTAKGTKATTVTKQAKSKKTEAKSAKSKTSRSRSKKPTSTKAKTRSTGVTKTVRLPRFYGKLDLTEAQRSEVLEVAAKYQEMLDELEEQMISLRAERDEKLQEPLELSQRTQLAKMMAPRIGVTRSKSE